MHKRAKRALCLGLGRAERGRQLVDNRRTSKGGAVDGRCQADHVGDLRRAAVEFQVPVGHGGPFGVADQIDLRGTGRRQHFVNVCAEHRPALWFIGARPPMKSRGG